MFYWMYVEADAVVNYHIFVVILCSKATDKSY